MLNIERTDAEIMMRGIASAVRYRGKLSDTQARILGSVGKYLLNCDVDVNELEPIAPSDFADAITDEQLRLRAVHGMVTLEIVANPVPLEVTGQVERFANALSVDEEMLDVAKDYAKGAMDVAIGDLIRNSYVAEPPPFPIPRDSRMRSSSSGFSSRAMSPLFLAWRPPIRATYPSQAARSGSSTPFDVVWH